MRVPGRGSKGRGSRPGLPPVGSCSLNLVVVLCLAAFLVGRFWGRTEARHGIAAVNAVQKGISSGLEWQRRKTESASVEVVRDFHSAERQLKAFPAGISGQTDVERLTFQLLSWKPRIILFPGFANASVCDRIVEAARGSMAPSTLTVQFGESAAKHRHIRTSSGTFLMGDSDPALAWVEQRMARVTGVPVENGEAFNVLRYTEGQQYLPHMDPLDSKHFGPQYTNRLASFLLYLSDVEAGGETVFPKEGGADNAAQSAPCGGFKVKPRKGDALLFWSVGPDRTIDGHALHGSCPVVKGEKWVATKWIRDGAF